MYRYKVLNPSVYLDIISIGDKGPLTVSMQICPFSINYCSFLRQQKLNYLAFIDRSTHSKYILTLILENFHVSSVTSTSFMKRGTWNFRSLKIVPISDFSNILKFCLIDILKLMQILQLYFVIQQYFVGFHYEIWLFPPKSLCYNIRK